MRPLALSIGDPSGIGPEIIAAAWATRREHKLPPFFVVGGAKLLADAAKSRGLDVRTGIVASADEATEAFSEFLPVLGVADARFTPGEPCQEGAKLALASLETATELATSGAVDAITTGPVAKSLLAQIGFKYPGQTEFLAAACNLDADEAVMMLAGPRLRTVPLTVHCPLSEVSGLISIPLITNRSTIVANSLVDDFGIKNPRVAIAGLNPHAGEDGKFGREEIEIIAPAIAALRGAGMDATGPHPADALFAPHARDRYDAAICMYHDQALIPIKALDFDQGVNVTLGLAIVRTSPDHGTAFDIAGKNIADPSAMIAAIKMASECANRRNG